MGVNPGLRFFLGGMDLEMHTIGELLQQFAPGQWHSSGQPWGVRASFFESLLRASDAQGETPVTVELPWDMAWRPSKLIEIDHHGERAGKEQPSSLRQVFDLLKLPPAAWTRDLALVAANDSGYIEAMQAVGAGADEIARIRAADRAAQGIDPLQEQQAIAALRQLRTTAGGRLSVVELPHARTAAAVDRLHPALGGPGYQALLVLSPGETNFYGNGEQIMALDQAFPGGWYGGALPERGYWGIDGRIKIESVVTELFGRPRTGLL